MKAKIIEISEIFDFKKVYLKDNPNPFYQRWDGKLYYPEDLEFCLGEKSIKELSKEYSEYMTYQPEEYIDVEEMNIDLKIYRDDATLVLMWLAENYEITLTPKTNNEDN